MSPNQPKSRIITPSDAPARTFSRRRADALSDYELLEMVLFAAQPRRDMKL